MGVWLQGRGQGSSQEGAPETPLSALSTPMAPLTPGLMLPTASGSLLPSVLVPVLLLVALALAVLGVVVYRKAGSHIRGR